jgi:hypothetical protein
MLERITGAVPQRGRAAALTGFGIGNLEDVYRRRLVASAQAISGPAVDQQQLDVMSRIQGLCEQMLRQMGGRAPAAPGSEEERLRRRQEITSAPPPVPPFRGG